MSIQLPWETKILPNFRFGYECLFDKNVVMVGVDAP